jgi:Uma2 family endonuclease
MTPPAAPAVEPVRGSCHAGIVTLAELYEETITLPRALRFPVEFRPPVSFDPEKLETWPVLAGRLEYVEGRLLFMPPCGDTQQDTVTDVVVTLGAWVRAHPEFVLGTNEAGMHLGGATRAADAAIWRVADLGAYHGGLRRVPPVLTVEVAGVDGDAEADLMVKARWYLEHGVSVVWIVLPDTREVFVVSPSERVRLKRGARLPPYPALPDLVPAVDELFTQIARARW